MATAQRPQDYDALVEENRRLREELAQLKTPPAPPVDRDVQQVIKEMRVLLESMHPSEGKPIRVVIPWHHRVLSFLNDFLYAFSGDRR